MNGEQTERAAEPRRPGPALWVLIVLFVVGVASLVYGWADESTQPDIGLLIVSYLFLMGVSQVGVVFCAITRLVHAQWAKPYYRLAEISTLAFTPFAFVGFLLIFVYAQDDLFYWLSPAPEEHLSAWLNIDWLLIRNLAALAVFYGLSTYYALKALKPDLADAEMQEADHREVAGQLYMLSPLVIAAFITCNTFIAWDFGMMLIPHWHSTVFPILFWFGNLFAGTAALIVFPALLGRTSTPDSHFGPDQVRSLGMMVTGFTLLWLYFFWAQFFVIWFGNLPHEGEPLWRQMEGDYGPFFWTMIAACFFLPLVAALFAVVKRSVFGMCVVAASVNLGIWISKYLMIMPVFPPYNQPFTHWIDIVLALGLLAGFLATIVVLAKRRPLYSNWEMRRES